MWIKGQESLNVSRNSPRNVRRPAATGSLAAGAGLPLVARDLLEPAPLAPALRAPQAPASGAPADGEQGDDRYRCARGTLDTVGRAGSAHDEVARPAADRPRRAAWIARVGRGISGDIILNSSRGDTYTVPGIPVQIRVLESLEKRAPQKSHPTPFFLVQRWSAVIRFAIQNT